LTHFKRNLRETLDKIVEKESKALHKSLSSELSEEEYNIQRQNVEGYLQKGIALISMQMIIKEIVEIENTIKERLNTLLNSVDADVAEKSDYSHLLKAKRNKFIEQKAFKTFMHNVRAPISDDLESSNSSSFSFTKKQAEGKKIEENETPLFKLIKSDSDKFCSKTTNTTETFQNKHKNMKNRTVFNLPQVKLDLFDSNSNSNELTDYTSFPNRFIRESPKHKTSPPTYKNKKRQELIISSDDVKYSKTTPLTIISQLYNFNMIDSYQRGYLKELIFENNQLLTECIYKYQLDGSIEKLYENISFLLKG